MLGETSKTRWLQSRERGNSELWGDIMWTLLAKKNKFFSTRPTILCFPTPVSGVLFASLHRLVDVDWLPLRVHRVPVENGEESCVWTFEEVFCVPAVVVCLTVFESCCQLNRKLVLFRNSSDFLLSLFLSHQLCSCSLPHPISLSLVFYKNHLFFFYPTPYFPDFVFFSPLSLPLSSCLPFCFFIRCFLLSVAYFIL